MNTSDDLANACFIVVAIVILIRWVIASSKGKLEIELPKRMYDPGEKIFGSVNLISHKRLEMECFYVSLICSERGGEGENSRNIYHEKHIVAEAGTLLLGNNKRFEFSFLLPGGEDTQEMTELSKNITGGLEAVANVTSAMKKHPQWLSWSVCAAAELPGIDLWNEKSIRINKIS